MKGCPVGAYEKDPVTGIVKHLDDQCFGCQYCTLMCPYDAPKYNKARGIVRKCDMCSDRLSHGEAPACVQACPNEAIRIEIIDRSTAIAAGDAQNFLPGAPAPEHTLPTTTYTSRHPMPNNMLPADFYRVSPEHSHPPLVVMLTLTQLSVGAFGLSVLVERLSGRPAGSPLAQTAFACTLAFVALFASVFHLGRPWLAWRAFIGLRTSWLSREAVAFGLFAKLAVLYGVLASAPLFVWFPFKLQALALAPSIQVGAALVGALAVFFSVMVYVATRRAQWSGTQTGIKFFGSALILGSAAVLTVGGFTSVGVTSLEIVTRALLFVTLGTTLVKVTFEASGLRHHADRQHSALKRMARVMLGDLSATTATRFALSLLGGLALPWVLLYSEVSAQASPWLTLGMFVLLLGGELCERYLFFCAAPASRMPGGIG
jgi:DMSO reductase anchor subunit/ferredoxin